VKFPAVSDAATLDACTTQVFTNVVGQRLLRTTALLKAFQSYIFNMVPHITPTSADTEEPVFVLLRPSSSHDWSCFKFHAFWYNHCSSNRCDEVQFCTTLSAEHFQAIGDALGKPYAGTFKHCHGDVANFVQVLNDLPQYPCHLPMRSRLVYWKLQRSCGAVDVIPASLDSFLCSVVSCTHGHEKVYHSVAWQKTLESLLRTVCDDDMGRAIVLKRFSDFLEHSTAEEWSVRPAFLARPMFLVDYQTLAGRIGFTFCGVSIQSGTLQASIVPPTSTSNSCIFLPVESPAACALPGDPATDEFWEKSIKSSYLRLHMAWQNRVHTFAKNASHRVACS